MGSTEDPAHWIYAEKRWILVSLCFLISIRTESVVGIQDADRSNSQLDLPQTVLPACSAWRADSIQRPAMYQWQEAFNSVDSDQDGLVSIMDIGWVFHAYLAATGKGSLDFGEDIRRVMEVIRSDAKVDLSRMEESHIDWKGFSLIMSAYAARALSPGQDGSRKMRRMDMEVLATAQQLLGSAESERLSILQNIPQHDRFATYGASLLMAGPEQRAANIAMLSDHQRFLLLSRRQQRIDLSNEVSFTLRATGSGSNASSVNCSSGSYLAEDGSYCQDCESCDPGFYRSGCGGNTSGGCEPCALGSVKNFTGSWNDTCILCPKGSSNRRGAQVSACFFMYTCQHFREAGWETTGQYHLSLRASPTLYYAFDELVPWEADGITPQGFDARLAYCDMSTDGGGWMLILCYQRSIFDTDGRNARELPVDPERLCYSHLYLLRFSQAVQRRASEVRLFCTSSEHNRTVHFKTEHQGPLGMALRGLTQWNEPSWWISNTTLMPDHSAYLPLIANVTQFTQGIQIQGADSLDDGFHNFPFFRPPDFHWAIRSNGRWECDNKERYYDTTRHEVWTR